VLLLTYDKTSKNNNLVIMIELTRAHQFKQVVGTMMSVSMNSISPRVIGRRFIYKL